MSRLIWDAVGEKFYEMGTKMGVLYPMNNTGAYDKGVAIRTDTVKRGVTG